MASIEKTIDVNVPVRTAYNQWTQFEEFPHFMEGVKEVRQLDDKNLHWHAEVMGKDVEWLAEITQQIPDERITWRIALGAAIVLASVAVVVRRETEAAVEPFSE